MFNLRACLHQESDKHTQNNSETDYEKKVKENVMSGYSALIKPDSHCKLS